MPGTLLTLLSIDIRYFVVIQAIKQILCLIIRNLCYRGQLHIVFADCFFWHVNTLKFAPLCSLVPSLVYSTYGQCP